MPDAAYLHAHRELSHYEIQDAIFEPCVAEILLGYFYRPALFAVSYELVTDLLLHELARIKIGQI